MARKRRKITARAGELNLTAMIDVAFQLLSFFIITIHPMDVMTNLDVFRPSEERQGSKSEVPEGMVRIAVFKDFYTLNEVPTKMDKLEDDLRTLSESDKNITVLITCKSDAQHKRLIRVLDRCAKLGLSNLSVISAP